MANRAFGLLTVIYIVLALFAGRLWWLQVVQYDQYATRSQGNYLKTEAVLAPRGRIFDRNGKLIAANRLAVDLMYKGGQVLYLDRILSLLKLSALPEAKDEPVSVMTNVPLALVPTLAELTSGQENIYLVERLERTYPRPISGPVLGYVLLANQRQVDKGYDPTEQVGVAGIERALEADLRGVRGVQIVEVNAKRERIRQLTLREPVPGRDVYLTLDYDLQKAAERALEEGLQDVNRGRARFGLPSETEAKGAIVAVDPATGEVLAMASAPSFDPTLFAKRPRPQAEIAKVMTDKNLRLLNRAVQPYTPGSTFKLVSSSLFLEKAYLGADTVFRCAPYIYYGGRLFKNWASYDMGNMTVREAIAQSCNTWYYQAAQTDPRKMVDELAARARELGIGRPTGLEVSEQQGFLPTVAWKRATYDQPWYPGESLSIAIGQGAVQVTPVELARMLATIIMSGRQPEFHLVKKIGNRETTPKTTLVPGVYWKVLQEGMRKTVTWGTAKFRLGDFPVPTAGKTGTAETPGKRLGYEHAWYMGYGPTDPGDPRPPLVVVVFFENGGGGFDVALPAAKKVMSAYWKVGEYAPKPTPPAPGQ